MSHAEICPICFGKGKIKKGMRAWIDVTSNDYDKPCHGCGGKGWVEVSAEVVCVNNAYDGTVTAAPSGTMVTLEFSPALPDADCCEITLTGQIQALDQGRFLVTRLHRQSALHPHHTLLVFALIAQ